MDRQTIIRLLFVFAVSFLISAILQQFFDIDLGKIKAVVNYFGPSAPIAYSALLFLGLTVPFNPISDFLVISLAALIFPPLTAIVATFIAHTGALVVNYWVGRKYVETLLKKLIADKDAQRIENLSHKINFGWIFGLRFLLPLTAIGIDVVSYASGLAKLPFGKFLLVSIIPWTIFNVLYFYSSSFLREINPALILVPAAVLVGIPILIISFRRRQTFVSQLKKLIGVRS